MVDERGLVREKVPIPIRNERSPATERRNHHPQPNGRDNNRNERIHV